MMPSHDKIGCFPIDCGIYWDCNIACEYCRSSPVRDESGPGRRDDRVQEYCNGLTRISRDVDTVMFKTSGWGGITTLPSYTRLFKQARNLEYEVLQRL